MFRFIACSEMFPRRKIRGPVEAATDGTVVSKDMQRFHGEKSVAQLKQVLARCLIVGERVPRTRGDEPVRRSSDNLAMFVFPAHAGMNRMYSSMSAVGQRVPRTRGDEPTSVPAPRYCLACSPRTRG